MIFISLGKFRKKPTKKMTDEVSTLMKQMEAHGAKFIKFNWTLGRYDKVVIMDVPDERAAMRVNLNVADFISTETMTAVPREQAIKLVD
jgi:uncharacterized protein with GYD domain